MKMQAKKFGCGYNWNNERKIALRRLFVHLLLYFKILAGWYRTTDMMEEKGIVVVDQFLLSLYFLSFPSNIAVSA